MAEARDLKLDLLALSLLALTIFLAAALATYDPADPVPAVVAPLDRLYQPDQLVDPLHEAVTNACGTWGALAADMLLTFLGVGAYYLVGSLALVDYLLLRRRSIDAPWIRALGWVASLAGLCCLMALVVPNWSPGPVIGPGGYVGALTGGLLRMHFALLGGMILALSVILGGLLLCTDYALLNVARLVLAAAVIVVTKRPRLRLWRSRRSAAAAAEVAPADTTEDKDHSFSVRVRGKRVVEGSDTETAEEPEAEESEAAWDEPEGEEEGWEEDEDAEEGEADEEAGEGEASQMLSVKGKQARADQPQGIPVRHKPSRSQRAAAKPPQSERDAVMNRLDQASLVTEDSEYELPDIDLLVEGDDICFEEQAKEVRRKAKILEKTFADFGFKVKVVEIETGPVIAQYEVELEAGLRLSKITGLADDLAIALRVPSVRIVAPIPGKNTVGIEVPNEVRQVVRLREVIEEANGKIKKMKIPLFLGKDVSGNPMVVDLATMPHLLIAGRTGTGKSVCLNAIITSMLMTRRPDEVRMLMIDPKMVELSGYGRLPHLMHPVVTDMKKAEAILAWAVEKMEERYALLAKAGVRHITSYNQLGRDELMERLQPQTEEEEQLIPDHLPFIVIVADEMADLMMTAGKEVEQHIIRLAQKSRAVGIHLILATQKPTVDVITGLIKSNLPARISFQVASRTDSRVVLDEMGADKLLGNGDMLFLWPGTSTLIRGQGTYLGDDEINAVVDAVSTGEQNFVNELVNLEVTEESEATPGQFRKRDELYEQAVDIVVREGRGSVSLLQRCLGIGYGRAARLIDFMAEDGIVGDYAGSQAREVTISVSDWEQLQRGDASTQAPPPPKRRSNKIRLEQDPEQDPGPEVGQNTGQNRVSEPQPRGPAGRSDSAPTPRKAATKRRSATAVAEPEYDEQVEEDIEDQFEDSFVEAEEEYEEYGEYEEREDEEEADASADDEEEYEEEYEADGSEAEFGEEQHEDDEDAYEEEAEDDEVDEYEDEDEDFEDEDEGELAVDEAEEDSAEERSFAKHLHRGKFLPSDRRDCG